MAAGARTPEELETLLEDAFVMHDRSALVSLFETDAVLASGDRAPAARGRLHIVEAAAQMWAREEQYLAHPLRVLQARRTALIAGRHATTVARRSSDGSWRYAIALLHTQPQP
jgi:Domain of unknown function (DUF4440)